jgi:uncharacterized membrane protein
VADQVVVVVGAYEGARGADEALPAVKNEAKQAKLKIHDAGIVRHTGANTVEINDTGDWGFAKGFVAGGLLGAVVMAAGGPVGWTIVGAGIVTGLAARLNDAKLNDDAMRSLGQGLAGGSSALILMIDPAGAEAARRILADTGATVTAEGLDEDALSALSQPGPSIG